MKYDTETFKIFVSKKFDPLVRIKYFSCNFKCPDRPDCFRYFLTFDWWISLI